jgi:hypothetical protein
MHCIAPSLVSADVARLGEEVGPAIATVVIAIRTAQVQ